MTTQPTQTDKSTLEDLINAFFEDIGLSDMPMEEKRVQVKRILGIIEGRAVIRLMAMLDATQRAEFEAAGTDEAIDAFLTKNNIDLGAITMEEAQEYREELMANAAYIQGRAAAMEEAELPKDEES